MRKTEDGIGVLTPLLAELVEPSIHFYGNGVTQDVEDRSPNFAFCCIFDTTYHKLKIALGV